VSAPLPLSEQTAQTPHFNPTATTNIESTHHNEKETDKEGCAEKRSQTQGCAEKRATKGRAS
jgi:hypothetical protein